MAPLSFLSLPYEVLIEIVSHLDSISLLQCTSTCKSLNEILNNSSKLQYSVALFRAGLKDDYFMSLSPADLLKSLRDRLRSWKTLDWTELQPIPVGGTCQAYELVAGTFSKSNGADLMVVWLPTRTSEPQIIYRPDLGIRLRDFAIDPTQDLVVILEHNPAFLSLTQPRTVRLHLRTISTNRPHPLAKLPVIQFETLPDENYGNEIFGAAVQLASSVMSIFFSVGPRLSHPRLLLWDWQGGHVLHDSAFHPLPALACNFSLLSSDSFLVTSTSGNGALYLFTLLSNPPPPPMLVAIFALPDVAPGCQIDAISIHSSPIHAHPVEHTSLMTPPESFIQVISIHYGGSAELYTMHSRSFSLFVHNRIFCQRVEEFRVNLVYPGISIPWTDWGPHYSRFIDRWIPTTWLRYVHGQRIVCINPWGGVDVLDFNFEEPSSCRQTFTRANPTRVVDERIFASEVVTFLPYHQATRPLPEHFYALMIDEDRVIGIQTDFISSQELKELHIYSMT